MLGTLSKDIRGLLVILVLGIGIASCESAGQQCYVPVSVTVKNNFYHAWPDSTRTPGGVVNGDTIYYYTYYTHTKDTTLPIPQLQVIGTPGVDSIFRISAPYTSSLSCLLNPGTDSISYAFGTDTLAFTDTITFYYTSSVHFVSNSCGYTYYYNIDNIKSTYHVIDSVALANSSVTQSANTTNVQFFFKN